MVRARCCCRRRVLLHRCRRRPLRALRIELLGPVQDIRHSPALVLAQRPADVDLDCSRVGGEGKCSGGTSAGVRPAHGSRRRHTGPALQRRRQQRAPASQP